MNKTIFSLICTNEDYEVISIQNFLTLASAQQQMQSEYDRELAEAKKAGYGRSDIEHICVEKNAYVECSDKYKYHWHIKEAPLPSADHNKTSYAIAVGRTSANCSVYHVRCTADEIQSVALAHYYYAKDNRLYGNQPICCAYAEGETFDWHNPDIVVLIDCM